MIKERIKNMDSVAISGTIQTHPLENVHRTTESRTGDVSAVETQTGNSAQPTVSMLKRLAPDSAEGILDFIDGRSKKLNAILNSYINADGEKPASTDHRAGLITAYPHSGHYSILSPAPASGNASGGGAGADLSYPAPMGEIPAKGSSSTMASLSVSILV